MKNIYQTIISCLLAIMLAAGLAFYAKAGSSFNQEINYEGKLTDSSGVAVADGNYCMKFSIYDDPTAGNLKWSEVWNSSSAKVPIASGLFSVLLGSHTSFTNIFNNSALYLEIQFDPSTSCTSGNFTETFSPRKQLGSVPSAFQADQLEGQTWESPGIIGSGTPNSGTFTNISVAGTGTFGFNSQITNGSEFIKFEDLAIDLSGLGAGTQNFPAITPNLNSAFGAYPLLFHGLLAITNIDSENNSLSFINVDTSTHILQSAGLSFDTASNPGSSFVRLDADLNLFDGSSYKNLTAGTITASSFVGQVASSTSDPVFSGSGLDDFGLSGSYTGNDFSTVTYTVEIASTGDTDNVKWKKNNGSWSGNIPIASPMQMSDGLEMNFGSGTGHTIGDQWVITVSITPGTGSFAGGVITKDNNSVPTLTNNGQIQFGLDGSSHRLYFYSNGAQYYIASAGSFEIPGNETIDPISNDQMQVGDLVMGKLNKNVGDKESSLHGVWVKWDSVKADLIKEIKSELGINSDDVKQINIQRMQMVDQATSDIYCTWISNGDWQKVKGDCSSIAPEIISKPSTQNDNTAPVSTESSPSDDDTPAQPIQQQTSALNIVSINPITDINVENGTALSSANLPATVDVLLSDNTNQIIQVAWNSGTPEYDPNTTGIYVFSGDLALPENITNENNLKATVKIIVPIPIENLASGTADLIQNTASGLLYGAGNFIKWIISQPIKKLSFLPILHWAKNSFAENSEILQAGLLSPIRKVLGK